MAPKQLTIAAVLALCCIAALATPSLAHASVPAIPAISNPTNYTDTFDNGRTDGWLKRDQGPIGGPSNWHVLSGKLVQASNIYGGSTAAGVPGKPGTMFIAGDNNWTNYDFSVTAQTSDDDAFGVYFRYTSPDDYYRFSMDSQRHYRRLIKVVDGKVSTIWQNTSTGYKPKTAYTIRVVAVGNQIQILLNGTRIVDLADSSLTHGRFGLYTWGCPTTFDNVTAKIEDDDFFTIAVVPDTQYETDVYPAMLEAQMQYLATDRAVLHLADVLQEGDVVNTYDQDTQWAAAAKYFDYLDGKVPFTIAAGNHDILDYQAGGRPHPVYPEKFDALMSKFPDYTVTGSYRRNDFLDTYSLLDAGGVSLLVLNLQYGAPDDVLEWAGQIVDQYPDRHVLLLTHDYLGSNDQIQGPGDTFQPNDENPTFNDGIDIWTKFVAQHPNVQFVLNGHVTDPTSPTEPWSVGRLVSSDSSGDDVYQTLTNYQTYNDGDGYLRLFKIYPATGQIDVTSYSPYTKTYLTDPDDQFSYTGVDLGAWPRPDAN
jgi:hypothetical protein